MYYNSWGGYTHIIERNRIEKFGVQMNSTFPWNNLFV